jgi:hypothetical protein
MKGALLFGGGFLVGLALMSRIKPANESNCCKRVAFGARAVIADGVGPLGGFVTGAFDALGLTQHIPRLLDEFGVPLDA